MAKIRVYELARELGVEPAQVLAALAANGESIRSASSALEPEVAQAVREKLRRPPATDEQPPGRTQRPGPAPRRAGPTAAVPRQARRDPPPQTVAVSDLPSLERLIAEDRGEGPRIREDRLALIRALAWRWAAYWFTAEEAAPWLRLRVEPAEATQFRGLGITPEMLQLPFQMPGRARAGGRLTYLTAFHRGDVTIAEIRDELVHTGHLPRTQLTGDETTES
jgi:hypothetical protein